jgi:hypothetical protein
MADIRLPDENTEFSKISRYDWDVVMGKNHDILLQVGRLGGYIHTIGGKWGDNDLYCWPRGEEPTYENVTPFDSNHVVDWGLRHEEHNYWGSRMGDPELDSTAYTVITRNGKDFYSVSGGKGYSIPKALIIMEDIQEHVIDFNCIDYASKEIVGRVITYNKVLCKITLWCEGQGCIILEPIKDKPMSDQQMAEMLGVDPEDYDGCLKIDIIGYNHLGVINWYPKGY